MTEAKFAAGPAIRSTNATPGVRPLSISDNAIGIEPVAQIYIGTATATITSMASSGYALRERKRVSGTATVIMAAITSPITSHLPTDPTMSTMP